MAPNSLSPLVRSRQLDLEIKTPGPLICFKEIISPIDREKFLSNTYAKTHFHIPGPENKFEGLVSWQAVNDLVSQSVLWTDKSFGLAYKGRMVPHESFCYTTADREGRTVQWSVMQRVKKALHDGATLALAYVDQLHPGLRAVAQTPEATLTAPFTASLFCSQGDVRGYGPHFDVQNVFALQISGNKVWRIYEARIPNACNIPGGRPDEWLPEKLADAKGNLLAEVEATAGDLLYIPHGQLHDAVASSGKSLPERTPLQRFRMRCKNRRLIRRGDRWLLAGDAEKLALDASDTRIVEWLLERDHFTSADLKAALPKIGAVQIGLVLKKLEESNLLEKFISSSEILVRIVRRLPRPPRC